MLKIQFDKALCFLFLLSSFNLTSQTLYWIGGDSDWNTPTNWSMSQGGATCNCLPQATDNVIIASGTGIIRCHLSSGNVTVASVKVENSTTLQIGNGVGLNNPKLTIKDPTAVSFSMGLRLFGILELYDSLEIMDAPVNGAQILSSGQLNIFPKGWMHVTVDDDSTDVGIYNLGGLFIDHSLLGQGTLMITKVSGNAFINSGALAEGNIEGQVFISEFDPNANQNFGITLDNNAILDIKSTAMIDIDFTGAGLNSVGIFSEDSQVSNLGLIQIKGSKNSGITNGGSAEFNNDGIVKITEYRKSAILNYNPSLFYNNMNLNIENASSEVQCVGLNNSSTFINMAGAILTIDQLPFTGSTAVNNKKIITNNGQIIIRHLNLGNAIWGDGAESDFTNNNLIKVDSGCGGGIYLTDSAKFENRDSIDIYRCHSVGLFASGASDFTNQGYLKIRSNLGGTFTGMSLNSGASVTNGLGNEIQLENLTAHRGIDLESSSLDNFGAIQVINSVFNFSVLELENAEMEVNYNSTIFLDTP